MKNIIILSSLLNKINVNESNLENQQQKDSYELGNLLGSELKTRINGLKSFGYEPDTLSIVQGLNSSLFNNNSISKEELTNSIEKIIRNESITKNVKYINDSSGIVYNIVRERDKETKASYNDIVDIKFKFTLSDGQEIDKGEGQISMKYAKQDFRDSLSLMGKGDIYEFKMPYNTESNRFQLLSYVMKNWENEKRDNNSNVIPYDIVKKKIMTRQLNPESGIVIEIELLDIN